MKAEQPLISFARLRKTFGGSRGVVAVDNLTLDVAEGEFLAIVGGSGSGKTTLLRLANRLIEPDSGSIHIGGENVAMLDPIALRRRIGYVFQSGGLFPHMSVADNIGITPKLLGTPRDQISADVDRLLDLVQLNRTDHRDRFPHELSGGQRQRVGFARALAADPAIMLMDEPFGAIDPITRVRLQDEFRQILKKVSKTVVIVTHDIDEAIKMGDRIAIMRDGRLLQYDTPEAILARPANDFVESFLGPDRAIKRLSLIEVASVMAPPNPQASSVAIKPTASLHDALALILTGDLPGLDVRTESGETVGYLSREAVLSAHR